jgi:TRAP-type C4-dicarboxylate transport system substrate-binding protein
MFGKALASLSSLAALAVALTFAADAGAVTTIKIGTLAPSDSPWGREFKKWVGQVSQETNGEVAIDFQWNGQAGDEVLMVQKMRSGQLDGAAITAVGLAQTGVTDVLLFQMPGVFSTWAKLDATRTALQADFNKQFEAKGFTVGGWGDVGAAKTMTVGFEVHHPGDLQGKGCYFVAGDAVEPRIFSTIGGITPKQFTVNEILPMLAGGVINVVVAPPLAAEQLQWASRITHISAHTMGFYIGAMIFSTARMNAVPQNLRDIVTARGNEMSARLTASIRNNDAQAYARLKASKTAYDLSEPEKKEWNDVFAKVRAGLRGTVFTPAVFDRVVQLAQ